AGHRVPRVAGNGGARGGDHPPVHGQRELAAAGHADQVLPGDAGPVPGEQRDGPALAPAHAGRQALVPPRELGGGPVLVADQGPVAGAELQPPPPLPPPPRPAPPPPPPPPPPPA